jgi:hypothetical protein
MFRNDGMAGLWKKKDSMDSTPIVDGGAVRPLARS